MIAIIPSHIFDFIDRIRNELQAQCDEQSQRLLVKLEKFQYSPNHFLKYNDSELRIIQMIIELLSIAITLDSDSYKRAITHVYVDSALKKCLSVCSCKSHVVINESYSLLQDMYSVNNICSDQERNVTSRIFKYVKTEKALKRFAKERNLELFPSHSIGYKKIKFAYEKKPSEMYPQALIKRSKKRIIEDIGAEEFLKIEEGFNYLYDVGMTGIYYVYVPTIPTVPIN